MAADDPHDLERFVRAQAPVWDEVRAELASGRKRSHWMWFIFPQLRGLGRSATAERYGIASRAEANAYLAHPLLGARLVECTRLMLAAEQGKSALAILGAPDDAEALLRAHVQPGLRLAAPEANARAVAVMQELGSEREGVVRMRLGPPVAWRPHEVWGVFSLFFG